MNRLKILISLIIIITISSCSPSDRLIKLTEICICEVSEHYIVSTDKEDNQTKGFSFTDSPLFEYNVPRAEFALSTAILINRDWNMDSLTIIKISIIEDVSGDNDPISYKYDHYELEKLTPKYFEILDLINLFVRNAYYEEYQECKNLTEINIEEDKFNSIMDQVKIGLESEYIDTRIVSYKKAKGIYKIYGGIWSKNETLDLFKMQLKDTKNGLKILTFEF